MQGSPGGTLVRMLLAGTLEVWEEGQAGPLLEQAHTHIMGWA